jgi:hypothetical protein
MTTLAIQARRIAANVAKLPGLLRALIALRLVLHRCPPQ